MQMFFVYRHYTESKLSRGCNFFKVYQPEDEYGVVILNVSEESGEWEEIEEILHCVPLHIDSPISSFNKLKQIFSLCPKVFAIVSAERLAC